jgi:sucrose-6-phosphate hydrolase SacC (GH32 family)
VRSSFLPLMFVVCPRSASAGPEGSNDLQELIRSTRALRALMQSDPHRPIYHFVAPEGHAIKAFASPDGREETVIRHEREQEQLVMDFVRSAIGGPLEIEFVGALTTDMTTPVIERVSQQKAPLKLKKGEALALNVFLDRSSIEVFANGRQVMTQVVYPELESSSRVKVFSGNEAITVMNVQSWALAETNAC